MFYFTKSFFLVQGRKIFLLVILITTIALLCAEALSLNDEYVQSIGSVKGNFSELLFASLLPVKPSLTKLERSQFTLSDELKQTLVGLLLGDLYAAKQKSYANARLKFQQSLVHEDYLLHLYELFKTYSSQAPKIIHLSPDKRTGKVYSRIHFFTYSLPCFNELRDLFYLDGKKIVPENIGDLLTPLGLAYWICDDGCWDRNTVRLATDGFTLEEVNLLTKVLNDKFGLKCGVIKSGNNRTIRISTKSVPQLQNLLTPIMPPMMLYKIQGNT